MEEKSTTCSITNSTVIATTSLRPAVPDRQAFQQALREYNQNINEISSKIDSIIGKDKTVGTLNILKQSKQEPCKRREQLKLEADQMKIKINEIKKLLAEKDALLSDIENDLVYRDESRLTTRLKELEIAYSQTNFTSSRTEKALIKEIDKLKRNRTKLSKYNVVMEEKRIIQLQLHEINERRSPFRRLYPFDEKEVESVNSYNRKRKNVLKSIREITNQLDNTERYIRQQRRDFLQLKDNLYNLHVKKKELVDEYNKKRMEYIDWSNRNKKDALHSSMICSNYPYPATYPATQRHQFCVVDEETLEPFYEQKMACKRLIEYLTSLLSRMPVECFLSTYTINEPCRSITVDGSEDSVDEYPPSFSALKLQESSPIRFIPDEELGRETSFINVLKKKNCKKSSKKPCQKICHPVQMIRFFEVTEIPIPHTYREIEHTLNAVRTLLKQYQEQTNIIIWEENDYRKLSSFSESEHTTDSVWNGSTDTSDRGSTFNLYSSSSFDPQNTDAREA
ncbi:Sucrose-6-phosphate hydrolase [Dirofilaria immitis]